MAREFGRQVAAAGKIDHHRQHHAEAGGREPPMPAIPFAQRAAHQRRHEAAQVDAHVIDVVRGLAARIAVAVEAFDLAGQAGQEQAVAQGDGGQRRVEQRLGRHHEMTQRHGDSADHHRIAPAQPAVGDHAAEHRREIHERRVGAVHQRGVFLVHVQMLGHVIDQQRPHAEEGEHLPHFGEEQHAQAARMAEPVFLARGWNHAVYSLRFSLVGAASAATGTPLLPEVATEVAPTGRITHRPRRRRNTTHCRPHKPPTGCNRRSG